MIMMADRKKTVAAILGPHPDLDKEKDEGPEAIQAAGEELLDCIHAKDAAGMLDALKVIFQEMDSEPHVEGPHVSEE